MLVCIKSKHLIDMNPDMMKESQGNKGSLFSRLNEYMKTRKLPVKLLFISLGITSTVWFLIRVIPKPSRAAYPCMKAAAPFMSGFVMYVLGLGSTVMVLKKARRYFYQARYLLFTLALLTGMVLSLTTMVVNHQKALAFSGTTLEDPNQPMGYGVGINPGRVVWIHAPDATDETCENIEGDYWSDDANTNQEVVDQMVSEAIQMFSSTTSDPEAWDAIFRYYNTKHDRGDAGYKAGEKIVIKLNMNTASRSEDSFRPNYKTVDTSPHLLYAVLNQLVNVVGVQPSDISVGDPGRTLDNIYWDKCHTDFPDVHYWGKAAGRDLIVPSDKKEFFTSDGTISEYLPKSYVEATYMINMPVLKKHHRGGISLSSKNHFGTFVPFRGSASYLHYSLPCPDGKADVSNGEYGAYRIFVDFIGHKDLGGKTILYLMDGLWTTTNWAHPPIKWSLDPFNNDYPSSLFVSQDPVAIESVGFDFLREEFDTDHPTEGAYDPTDHTGPFPQYEGVDDFLHQAADSANWSPGITYDPENDGIPLPSSMGAHEHWNNATDKQYSRNLGADSGIELVYSKISTAVGIDDPVKDISNSLLTLSQNYPNPFISSTSITYQLTSPASIKMSVYDINGKLVDILKEKHQPAGDYTIIWNGSSSSGDPLITGIYLLVAEVHAEGQIIRQTKEMMIRQ